ncbi:glutamate-5-semialdehyde dehydrogenase [Arcanobacterium pluranimalium]|uniref:glutamate-5-semialdehyde dehydrogenase n=1 Tax=Arcanobacterium pluranimalium TaxID=108028 RepID=UPI0019590D00|nr:glutamate-5-semialdehyde dehydrogenase [Arcanobacterium pluranimalium]MBM7825237.1 glutamate-5-semialdehyde dehydrogenase [Arcanobacterium pluranimalium]
MEEITSQADHILPVDGQVRDIASRAKSASFAARSMSTEAKNTLLAQIAHQLLVDAPLIEEANARDMLAGREQGMSEGLLDRLYLDQRRIESIAQSVRDVIKLPDPVGEILSETTLPNGLALTCKRVAIGVVGMIYEARPNVTVDAAVLALKSGNAVVLRGGSAAIHTNEALVASMKTAIRSGGGDPDLVNTIDEFGREGATALMRARGLVDLIIPRGGAGLIKTVIETATVPVIETGVGNCHIYVDKYADLNKAVAIVENAKLSRVGVCNAAEKLLVHADVAQAFLPRIYDVFAKNYVTVHADVEAVRLAPKSLKLIPACARDWDTEYLAKEIAVRIVGNVEEAIEHIRTYSTGHTEAIISQDEKVIERFVNNVDSAAVMINASTRFTDGGQFGFGAEIGISTQKLHVRGPMGLTALTSTMWIVTGDGHVRD